MDPQASSQILFARLQNGEPAAAEEIFNRYVERLLALARTHMTPQLRVREDEEDVVQSVYRSFFVRSREGQFRLQRSGDLWRLLATITVNKIRTKARFHGAAKRQNPANTRDIGEDDGSRLLVRVASAEPTAEDLVSIEEELQRVMTALQPLHRLMLELRLQGDCIEEIAQKSDRSEHQVRRVLSKVSQQLEARLLETSRSALPS